MHCSGAPPEPKAEGRRRGQCRAPRTVHCSATAMAAMRLRLATAALGMDGRAGEPTGKILGTSVSVGDGVVRNTFPFGG